MSGLSSLWNVHQIISRSQYHSSCEWTVERETRRTISSTRVASHLPKTKRKSGASLWPLQAKFKSHGIFAEGPRRSASGGVPVIHKLQYGPNDNHTGSFRAYWKDQKGPKTESGLFFYGLRCQRTVNMALKNQVYGLDPVFQRDDDFKNELRHSLEGRGPGR